MFTRTHVRAATLAAVALSLAAGLPAAAAAVHASSIAPAHIGNPAARVKRLFAPPARLHMPLGGRHHAGPLATSYTIDDIGAPSHGVALLENPTMFNNSGQIAGNEYNRTTGTSNCMAFTGSHWVRVNQPNFQNCTAMSMTNANPSSGAFQIVGFGRPSGIDSTVGFVATLNARSSSLRAFRGHVPSELEGINNGGTAIGYAYYNPPGGFFETDPPFVLSAGRFRPLQPQCTTRQPLCMADVTNDSELGSCPFGGCSITDGNIVLGDDYDSEWFYEVDALGQSGSAENIPLPYDSTYPVGINNALQIAYADVSTGDYQAWQYQVGASAPASLGAIPGSTCVEYYPFAQSNTGEVVGYAFDCPSGTPTYWTWDSVNGMQDLDAAIPPNSYQSITPYGVNDAGRVLVELDDSGVTHWGMLVPAGSAHRKR